MEQPFRHGARGEQCAARLAEVEKRLARSGGARAAAGDEYRTLRLGQGVDELGQLGGVGFGLWRARLF